MSWKVCENESGFASSPVCETSTYATRQPAVLDRGSTGRARKNQTEVAYNKLPGDEHDDGRVSGRSGVGVEGRDAVLDRLEREALQESTPEL